MSVEVNEKAVELTAMIVTAYAGNNKLAASELSGVVADVFTAITALGSQPAGTVEPPAQLPAIDPKRSIQKDYLICLEDGQKFKSLKRHLKVKYGLTPDAYRQKWDLPSDYPMVSPNYSKERSDLAKAGGLGRKAETPARKLRAVA